MDISECSALQASKGVFIALNIRLMERGLDLETGDKVSSSDLDKRAKKPLGSLANPLARHEWIGLIMTHVAQHTDSGLQQEDLEAASRCASMGKIRPYLCTHSTQILATAWPHADADVHFSLDTGVSRVCKSVAAAPGARPKAWSRLAHACQVHRAHAFSACILQRPSPPSCTHSTAHLPRPRPHTCHPWKAVHAHARTIHKLHHIFLC